MKQVTYAGTLYVNGLLYKVFFESSNLNIEMAKHSKCFS